MKKNIPTCHAKNVFDIDVKFFLDLNIKYLLIDLDNTLDSYKCEVASLRVKEFNKLLEDNDIHLIICSNNNKKRVEKYANSINVSFIYKCYKPFTRKIKKYLKNKKIDTKNCIIIGDQLSTDIKCGNNLNIKTILVDDLVNSNQLVTRFNKFMTKRSLDKLKKNHLLIDWRDYYVRIQESK